MSLFHCMVLIMRRGLGFPGFASHSQDMLGTFSTILVAGTKSLVVTARGTVPSKFAIGDARVRYLVESSNPSV